MLDSDDQETLSVYLKDLRRHPLLSRDQATALHQQIEQLDLAVWRLILCYRPAARLLRAVLAEHPLEGYQPTAGPEIHAQRIRAADLDQLVLRAVQDRLRGLDGKRHRQFLVGLGQAEQERQRARTTFLAANLRLVVSIAKRYANRGLPMDDLIQEGNIGLLKAVDRFDTRLGNAFSTYASWWIRHAINRGLADTGREIRLPVHMQDQLRVMAQVRKDLGNILGRRATPAEIAESLGRPLAQVTPLLLQHKMMSLDQPAPGTEEDMRLGDALPDDTMPLDDQLSREYERAHARALLERLPPKLQEIIRRRFGIDGQVETLRMIGDERGNSRERIRQLEVEAMDKLRRLAGVE